jgi:uncharacterized protein YcbX
MSASAPTPHIAQLWIYPLKSAAGIALPYAELTPYGLAWDRQWMVVDAQGRFVSQREVPALARVQPQLKGDEMILRAPGMLPLHVNLYAYEADAQVTVWGDSVPALDLGRVASQWISDCLSQTPEGQRWVASHGPLRLVRHHPDHPRASDPAWTQGDRAQVAFADGFALLVTSQAALDECNDRLQAQGHAPVDMRRFRPNLVLSGLPPHGEDDVQRVEWVKGDVRVVLKLAKPCPRCAIPDVDPDTGERSEGVNATLATYRSDARLDGALTFGMNAYWLNAPEDDDEQGPMLQVGDAVSLDHGFGPEA